MADDTTLEDRENLLARARRDAILSKSAILCDALRHLGYSAKENRVKLLASSAREIPTRVANHGHRDTRSSFRNELVYTPFAFGTDRKLPRPFSRHMRLRDCFQSRHEWYSILPTVDDRRVSKVATCFVDYSTN